MFTEKEMPKDVQEYLVIMSATGGMMGLEMYKRCQVIIDNNPKWFVWEHKYKSIPKEVHNAYMDEKYPNRNKPLVFSEGSDKGFLARINESRNVPFNLSKEALDNFSIGDAMKDLFEMQEKQDKEMFAKEKQDKELWDKHYKKYKLEFRSDCRR